MHREVARELAGRRDGVRARGDERDDDVAERRARGRAVVVAAAPRDGRAREPQRRDDVGGRADAPRERALGAAERPRRRLGSGEG